MDKSHHKNGVDPHYRRKDIDFALCEYLRQSDENSDISLRQFSAQYPAIQSALIEAIGFYETVANDPEFANLLDHVIWPSCGDQVGSFLLGQQIGAGAFARVHLATDLSMGCRQIVLKLSVIESDEMDILGRLIHPNILFPLSVHDISEWGLTGIVMPFLGTATLDHLISFIHEQRQPANRFCVEEFLSQHSGYAGNGVMGIRGMASITAIGGRIAVEVSEALAFAHERGFIHSDVKPENILLANDGTAKLLDFNLALQSNESSVRPLGGTRRYMSPEHCQALADREGIATIDSSVDVYSLAMSLIALFSKERGTPRQSIVSSSVMAQSETSVQSNVRKLIGWRFNRLLQNCIHPNVTVHTPEG